jgi:cytochrome oxidase assembly protein ShyY1
MKMKMRYQLTWYYIAIVVTLLLIHQVVTH